MERKKILVTGGAGFLGSHLCKRLIDAGCSVICLDNLSTGSIRNIAFLEGHPRFSFLNQDVCTPLDVDVEAIYNLACPASPVQYQAHPVETLKTSVIGALNVLELAKKCRARIVQASTSEVYGDPEVHPQHEGYFGHVNPIGFRSCYDEGKRCAETLFFDYMRVHGVDIGVARIFNTYGPHMALADGRVVSNFIVQALQGRSLTVYGRGEQTRSFCYVDDLIEGLILLMESGARGPINLGNPHEVSVRDLAEMVIRMTNSASSITEKPLPSDDPKQRRPSIKLAEELLGWHPKVSLSEGLTSTIHYFSQTISTA